MIYLRLAASAIVALALYGAYWSVDRNGYQRAMSEMRDSALVAAQEQAKRLKLSQEKHDADQATIARLAADARRVRVNFPTCTGSGKGADGSAGILSDRVDAAFADLQEATGRLVQRCDQLNIDAIRQNDSLP